MKKLYILVNKDLKIGKGKFAGQSAHASWTYAIKSTKLSQENLIDLAGNENLIGYIYLSQETLENIEKTNSYITIRDKGLTQLQPNSLTCIVLGYMTEEEKDTLLNEFNSGIFNTNKEVISNIEKGSDCNLAMYIIVNNNVSLAKEDLAKYVSTTMFKLHNEHSYSIDTLKDYMVAQKKIVLKCNEELLNNIDTSNAHVVIKDNKTICINIGIHEKSEVQDFVKTLKLYSK